MAYITPDIVNDDGAVAEGILAGVADRIPGFAPQDHHLVAPLAEANGVAIATAVTELKAQIKDAYRGVGQRIFGIPPRAAAVATATSTWTLTTSDGYSIRAGLELHAQKSDGTVVVFTVAETVDVPAGTTVQAGVPLVAVEAGTASNGATGAAQVEPTDDFGQGIVEVASVVLDAPSANGEDAEDPDDYADRLEERASRRLHLTPRSVNDYAAAALDVDGIVRAIAINRLDPGNPGVDSPGHLTVFAQDVDGAAPTGTLLDALEAYYAAIELPVNVTVHVAGADDVDIAATATITAAAGVDPVDLKARAEAAIAAMAAKATWDYDRLAAGRWRKPVSSAFTMFDVVAAIDPLAGLAKVTAAAVNGGASVALPAPLSIPNLTAATVTVT